MSGNGQLGSRVDQLRARLTAMASELSGYDEADLAPNQTFLELGFDSLFLTQLASMYQKEFGVKITFRQLIDDVSTIDAMAVHLDGALPPDAVEEPAAEAPEPAEEAAPVESEDATTPVAPAIQPAAPRVSTPAHSNGLAGVLAQQVALMAQQLELLREARQGRASAAGAASKVSAAPKPSAQTSPSETADKPAPTLAKKETPALPAGFGPSVSSASDADKLDPRQQAHVDRLIARYNAKTAGSKARTQQDRAHHADPRTAAGFNHRWKEIVYPIVVKKSLGAHLWDIDDNQYIDILNGFGPNYFGHRAPFITEALKAQLDSGYEVGPQTPHAGDAAKLLAEITGMDRVSWVNTGSEAVQAAIRISRTVTGRDKIVVFKGDYHGNFDEVLVRGTQTPKGARTLPMAPGIPFKSVENVIVLDYGEASALDAIREYADEIAAVLVEPVQSRRPEFQPREFLHELRALTKDKEIVLVFDEVITGFRICPGGAQEYFGVKADMATYGKIIGGGMPIGVVAGRSEFMDTFDGGEWQYGDDSIPSASVTFFAGTFVRHPMAIAAAYASLQYIKNTGPALQNGVNRKTTRLATTLNEFFEERGVKIHVAHFASQMFIRVKEENELSTLFFYHLRDRGIHVLEGFPSYVTAAHTDEDIDAIIAAVKDTVHEMQADGLLSGKPAAFDESQWRQEFPLTDAQSELWFASQLDPMASCAFNESDSIVIDGRLDKTDFQAAVEATLKNHEAFSLRFDPATATQWLDEGASFPVAFYDMTAAPEAERELKLEKLLASQALTPFDLENGPLVRPYLVRLSEDKHVFTIYCHHIVFDGYSAGIIVEEIVARYDALRANSSAEIPETQPFSVYAAKLAKAANSDEHQKSLEYYRKVFGGGTPAPLDVPTDRPRAATRSYRGATAHREIGPELSRRLTDTGKKLGVSKQALLLSGFSALLSRLSSQEDVVIGVPTAGQAHHEIETVGFCVNILSVRITPSFEQPFNELVLDVQSSVFGAFENQDMTLSEVVRDLSLPRDPSRLPLIEAVFNYSRYFADLKMSGCKVSARENARQAIFYDFFFNITETADVLVIDWDYAADLFDKKTIERWIDHYINLLEDIVDSPEKPVGRLALGDEISGEAVDEMLGAYSPEQTVSYELNDDRRVCDLFDNVAAKYPDAVAVICDGEEAKYQELQARANQLAHFLISEGAKPGDIIGLMLDRTIDCVAAVLAVWKMGGAYLPLDPAFPVGRLAHMIEDAGVQIILSESDLKEFRPDSKGRYLDLDKLNAEIDSQPIEPPPYNGGGSDRAYVIYTSGSTGKPKGVENTHRATVNFLDSMAGAPGLSQSDRLLAVTTLSFDISILELFLPLSVGATVVLAIEDEVIDGYLLGDLIEEFDVTVMQSTPATWRLLLESDWQGRPTMRGLCGGEALSPQLAEQLLPLVGELWNMYGPTETTVWSSCAKIEDAAQIHVGAPIAKTEIHILDDAMRPVPKGTAGDVWIGGGGVATGYLGQPQLTLEKFKDDPFIKGPGRRIYCTGDVGLITPSGDLQIHGRRDNQVKIRGYRIELGEIETTIERHDSVSQAVASVRQDKAGDPLLVAYLVVRDGAEVKSADLRRALSKSLPQYMIPQLFVALDEIPLTANNKVDRNALPEPEEMSASSRTYVAPRNESEKKIAEIWAEILHREKVSVTDNFFELGGQSLQVAQMVAKVRQQLGLVIAPQAVIYETLEQLAANKEAVSSMS